MHRQYAITTRHDLANSFALSSLDLGRLQAPSLIGTYWKSREL